MEEIVCAGCGRKLTEYLKTGMLGCTECYQSFEGQIVRDLTKIQKSVNHVGKVPKCSTEDKKLIASYRTLLSQKERAGIDGKFKEMAEISAKLFEITLELKKRGLY